MVRNSIIFFMILMIEGFLNFDDYYLKKQVMEALLKSSMESGGNEKMGLVLYPFRHNRSVSF